MKTFLCVLALLSARPLAAPAPEKNPEAEALQKLEGAWVVARVEVDGMKVPAELVKDFRLDFKGHGYTMRHGQERHEGKIKIDPTRKPATLDIMPETGSDKGKTQLAIYFLQGNLLTICGAAPGKERPEDFDTKGKKAVTLLVLRRQR
jgi:uncharacterized protein (TIGR03067 family)